MTQLECNPYAHDFHDDPFPIYRRLRDEAPCYRNEALGFWALSRYDDVLAALHDPDTYCSRHGISLEQSTSLPMLITTDPPDHTGLRRLVSRVFTPRRIADLEPYIRSLADRYLDAFVERGEADVIASFAAKLPMDVISQILGVRAEDRDMLREWTDALLDRAPGDPDVTPAGIEAAGLLYTYFFEHVRSLRGAPGDDLTSALLSAELDGERLTDEWVVGFCFLLIIAGNETTTKLLANCLLALQRNPGVRRVVTDDPGRIPDAVEEILRYEGSTQLMARTTTRDVELHGVTMPAGEKVLLLLGSANRDERVRARPDDFDLDRDRSVQHVGLGHGIHVCLGAALARLEMRVSLEEIFRRLPDFEIDEAGLERVHSGNVRGYAVMPMSFAPAPRGRPVSDATEASGGGDIEQIRALVHEYAFRLDAGDLDGVAALFEHAEFGSTQRPERQRGTAEVRTIYDDLVLYDDGTPRTMHLIANVTVAIVPPGDEATSQCYFSVIGAGDGIGLQTILGGEYRDRFEKVSGTWRFRERIVDPKLIGDLSHHMRWASKP